MIFEWVHTRGDGTPVDLEISLSMIPYKEEPTVLCIMRDIGERKRTQNAMDALQGRLIRSQEEERKRIATDLHGDINQRLALLNVKLELLCNSQAGLSSKVIRQVKMLSDEVNHLSTDIDRLFHELHPSRHEQVALVPALTSLCDELSKQHSIEIDFSHREMPHPIPDEVSSCLYRIARELLQNVVRHGGARGARIRLTGNPKTVHFQVSDPGAEQEDPGLHLVRERLKPLGGDVSVQSHPGRGTRIDLRIPLPAPPE